MELDKVGKEIGWKEVTELNRNAVHRQLDELNGKISSARIAIKGSFSPVPVLHQNPLCYLNH